MFINLLFPVKYEDAVSITLIKALNERIENLKFVQDVGGSSGQSARHCEYVYDLANPHRWLSKIVEITRDMNEIFKYEVQIAITDDLVDAVAGNKVYLKT